MFNSFLTFINQRGWGLSAKRTLLTVSGGIDSVVMLDLFHRAGLRFSIAHCNFGLRGEDSDADEKFVRELAVKFGCPIYVKFFDTKIFAKSTGTSTQMAARTLRYNWFEEIRIKNGYDFVATAHHLNDSIETTLLNLSRGTGIAGLSGVPVQTGQIIRPMLFATREVIKQYIDEHGLIWREDSSNSSVDYKRNKIRHQVIHVLKQINPSLEQSFMLSSERIRSAGSLLDHFLSNWALQAVESKGDETYINIQSVLQMPEPAYMIWFVLKGFGFTYQQAEQIANLLDGLSGKVFYSPTHVLLKDREKLVVKIATSESETGNVSFEVQEQKVNIGGSTLSMEILAQGDNFELIKDKSVAYFDLGMLNFPLSVRKWAIGDLFCPFGMGRRKKKVSDLLIDAKFSAFEKEKVQVLVDNKGEIIWVIGVRSDERYRVEEKTKNILKIFLNVTD